jgi:uncharacterized protein (TIGR02145 family)
MGLLLYSCKTDEIILYGEISGLVTDSETGHPLQASKVKVIPAIDSTITGSDGTYLFKRLVPGNYDIQASKSFYGIITKNVEVISAKIKKINFALNKIPAPSFSYSYLDFGFDLTTLSFTISNMGMGKLSYYLSPGKDWITVYPISGNVTNETDTINVTINRTGLSANIFKESIGIIWVGQDVNQDTIKVFLNGVMDSDLQYYKTVKIGTQIWMAENLNTGTRIGSALPKDNGIIEKYCFYYNEHNCEIYGGLYQWDEMMQYHQADNGIIGTTQGVCPVGWHIPTSKEWLTLINFLGGTDVAGGKLKETGTEHWLSPNTGASNESGFSALGGDYQVDLFDYCSSVHAYGVWASSTSTVPYCMTSLSGAVTNELPCISYSSGIAGCSVRCIKDLPGK